MSLFTFETWTSALSQAIVREKIVASTSFPVELPSSPVVRVQTNI